MWRVLFAAVMIFAGSQCARAAYWQADFGDALRRAYGENRIVLMFFTSSDNCGSCTRLQEEVFSAFEFQRFADRHLILVEVDFPRWKRLESAQAIANRRLQDKYQAWNRPTIVLLNSRGEEIGRYLYMPGGADVYIRAIERLAKLTDKTPARESEPAALFSGAPTGPPPKYKELTLKSISGTGDKRLALINNATLAAGESGKVRLGEREMKIRCEEIRDASVIVTMDGKTGRRELRLLPAAGKPAQQANAK